MIGGLLSVLLPLVLFVFVIRWAIAFGVWAEDNEEKMNQFGRALKRIFMTKNSREKW